MKEYIAPLLRAGALIVLLYTIYGQNKVINEYKSKYLNDSTSYYKVKYDTLLNQNYALKNQVDSMYNELFIQKTMVGRYELGLDYLKERNFKDYSVVKHFIETQTE